MIKYCVHLCSCMCLTEAELTLVYLHTVQHYHSLHFQQRNLSLREHHPNTQLTPQSLQDQPQTDPSPTTWCFVCLSNTSLFPPQDKNNKKFNYEFISNNSVNSTILRLYLSILSLNCEIKNCNYRFYFFIPWWKPASIYLWQIWCNNVLDKMPMRF